LPIPHHWLLLAKENQLISTIKPYLQIIQQTDAHLSPKLIDKALVIAGE
jgi:predicted nucleic acid-binding protein